jgi:glutamine amidotransferase
MRVSIVDYGVGNIRSVANSLWRAGAEPQLIGTPESVRGADRLVLPGVGAAGVALAALRGSGLDAALDEARRAGTPILGICVGMQMMAETIDEFGRHEGLGWFPGEVARINAQSATVPHMGWTRIERAAAAPAGLADVLGPAHFYFCHSNAMTTAADRIAATAHHGASFAAAIAADNVVAVQFHPEKSQQAGLRLLERFIEWRP